MISRRTLILGYGREGQSLLRYLRTKAPGMTFGVADKRADLPVTPELHGVNLFLGETYLTALSQFDVVYRSPGIPLSLPAFANAKASGVEITSLMNLFFSTAPGTIIGVTGTKGKSTTSALIAQLLRSQFPDVRLAGNIGRPAIDELDGASGRTLFVVELSSFQLEDLRHSPRLAVILGVVPEHLDHHETFEAYRTAKSMIAAHQGESDMVVFNPHSPEAQWIAEHSPGRRLKFTREPEAESQAFVRDGFIVTGGPVEHRIIAVKDLPVLGQGNLQNVLAALTAAAAAGGDVTKFADALLSFRPLEHRLEAVGEFHGIRFYNDSLSTIPEAAVNALDALGDSVTTLLAGGHDRGLQFESLAKALCESNVRTLILFPTTGEKILQALRDASPEKAQAIRPFRVDSMEEAVRLAFEHTEPGRVCLLSPASSSFGMFRDYQDRGKRFRSCIESYARSADI